MRGSYMSWGTPDRLFCHVGVSCINQKWALRTCNAKHNILDNIYREKSHMASPIFHTDEIKKWAPFTFNMIHWSHFHRRQCIIWDYVHSIALPTIIWTWVSFWHFFQHHFQEATVKLDGSFLSNVSFPLSFYIDKLFIWILYTLMYAQIHQAQSRKWSSMSRLDP